MPRYRMAPRDNMIRWEMGGIIAAAAIGLFYLLVTCLQPVRTDDVFWHLKLGEILWQGKEFPAADPFLFTSPEDTYPFYHEWLFQVGLHLVHSQWGMAGVRGLTALLALLACGAVWYWARGMGGTAHFPWLASGVLVLFAYQRLIQLRPHLVTVIFFFLLLGYLWRHRDRIGWGPRLVCAATMILWANLHSVALIIFPFWLVLLVFWCFPRRSAEADLPGHAAAFALSLGAVMVNPMGWKLYVFYWLSQSHDPDIQVYDYTQVLDEWGHWNPFGVTNFLPLSSPVLVAGFLLLLILLLFRLGQGIHSARRLGVDALGREELIRACWGVGAAVLMLFAVRFFWMAPLVLGAIVLLPGRSQARGRRWPHVAGSVVWALAVWLHFQHPGTARYRHPWHTAEQRARYLDQDVDEVKYHWEAIQFLRELQLEGRVFNPYHLGGALSFGLSPRMKTFIDGRMEHYLDEVNRDHHTIESVGRGFEQLLEKYDVEVCFVPISRYTVRLRLALKELDWVLIYTNFQTQIYCRADHFARYQGRIMAHYGLEGETTSRQARKDLYDRLLTTTVGIPGWPIEGVRMGAGRYMRTMNLLLMHLFIPEARQWYETASPRLSLSDARLVDYRQVFARYNQVRKQLREERHNLDGKVKGGRT